MEEEPNTTEPESSSEPAATSPDFLDEDDQTPESEANCTQGAEDDAAAIATAERLWREKVLVLTLRLLPVADHNLTRRVMLICGVEGQPISTVITMTDMDALDPLSYPLKNALETLSDKLSQTEVIAALTRPLPSTTSSPISLQRGASITTTTSPAKAGSQTTRDRTAPPAALPTSSKGATAKTAGQHQTSMFD